MRIIQGNVHTGVSTVLGKEQGTQGASCPLAKVTIDGVFPEEKVRKITAWSSLAVGYSQEGRSSLE